jgi:deoxyinosine 3'endonuclease (endonuclease V)
MIKSRSKSLQNREIAREAIYRCVNNHRRIGLKTVAALDQVTPYLGIARRKVHGLFFNEKPAPMSAEERHRIIDGVVKAHFWLAQQLRDWADQIEAETYQFEARERAAWQGDTSPERRA